MSVNQSIKPISIEYADNIKIGGCDLIDLAKKYRADFISRQEK